MSFAFQHDRYLLKRQVLALTGKFRIFDPAGNLVMYSEQKMFRLREDIRVYADETRTHELLIVKARQILDLSAAYDVMDGSTGQRGRHPQAQGLAFVIPRRLGGAGRADNPIGVLHEDSPGLALLRRLVLGSLLPQNYDLLMGGQRVRTCASDSTFAYHLDLDFSMDGEATGSQARHRGQNPALPR
jgi:hypothetical protein